MTILTNNIGAFLTTEGSANDWIAFSDRRAHVSLVRFPLIIFTHRVTAVHLNLLCLSILVLHQTLQQITNVLHASFDLFYTCTMRLYQGNSKQDVTVTTSLLRRNITRLLAERDNFTLSRVLIHNYIILCIYYCWVIPNTRLSLCQNNQVQQ